jgi:Ca-activated chloride channel family protein
VSFGAPQLLWALLLVPLAVAAQLAARRRARRYAVRHTAVPAARLAAAVVPSWRRHLPAALAVAALTALALALAKPQRTVAVPVDRASIMIVTDHSRSMLATDVDPDRITAAKNAAHTFLGQLPGSVRVGVVTFSDTPDGVLAPSQKHDDAAHLIDAQEADGATDTGDALQSALDAIAKTDKTSARPHASIVLLSDGATTVGRNPLPVAREARNRHIPIYTVSLGTADAAVPNPNNFGPPLSAQPDPEALKQIADASGGQAFTAEDSSRLSSIYKALGAQLGTKKVRHEATAAFAAGGLALLLGAGLASMRRLPRLP